MTTTLSVSASTRARVAELAAQAGMSMGDVVDRALDAYTRARFWEQTGASLQRRSAEADEDAEQGGAWDNTIRDGFDGD